jgi:hypothetical protein
MSLSRKLRFVLSFWGPMAEWKGGTLQRAKYRIGRYKGDNGEDEARELAYFLGFHQDLKYIELELRFDLIEDPNVQNLIELAVLDHGSLMGIKIWS